MSSHATTSKPAGGKLDLSRLRNLPLILVGIGLLGAVIGGFVNPRQLAYSYLLAFVFFFSLAAGCLFLVLVHHLFDAAWSVPLRRLAEHGANLIPWFGLLFIPVALFALLGGEKINMYPWMQMGENPDHALHAKHQLLNKPAWLGISIGVFAILGFLANRLRFWSVKQDETGGADCTQAMRKHSYWGMFAFAFLLTIGIILWVKSLEHQWFSTMFGVYYFAESVWVTLATVYMIMTVLRKGPLASVLSNRQVHDLGVLWFAFTVFYAYIHFSQYFIIWNANIPEETFHYLNREKGIWWQVGMLLIFGHFFVPFLTLLRIDFKINPAVSIPLAIWCWMMHYCDTVYNIMPVLHPEGGFGSFLNWMDLACLAFIGGVVTILWLKAFNSVAPYPKKDPRLAESVGAYGHHPVATYAAASYEGKR